MYVIIIGAGEVGSYLARLLIDEGNDVAIIEADEELARKLDASIDALVVHGSGVSRPSLEKAGLAKADLLLAVTQVDEVNLIACMTAERFGKDVRTVARVRDTDYIIGERHLCADDLGVTHLVGPERAVAEAVVDQLSYEGSGDVHYFVDDKLSLLELPLTQDSPLVHETLAELNPIFPANSLVAAIGGPRGLRIPTGADRISQEERAYVLTQPSTANEWWILSGNPWHHVRHVLIVGCGDIGFHVARMLERRELYPTIIEVDRKRGEWLSQQLTKSLVLQADGTDPEVLREQLDERADAVVVLLEDNEAAVLVGLFAKHLGAKKVIVRSDKLAYAPIAHKLGVDALISPRRAVADDIVRFIRRGHAKSAQMLGDHDAEIIELTLPDKPKNGALFKKPIKALNLPTDALVGAVVRNDQALVADGDTQLRPGDSLLIIALPSAVSAVMKTFD